MSLGKLPSSIPVMIEIKVLEWVADNRVSKRLQPVKRTAMVLRNDGS